MHEPAQQMLPQREKRGSVKEKKEKKRKIARKGFIVKEKKHSGKKKRKSVEWIVNINCFCRSVILEENVVSGGLNIYVTPFFVITVL